MYDHCLQESKLSICSGPLLLPHCAAGAGDKVDRVWSRCTGHDHDHPHVSRAGVAVICWGCGVWHRYNIVILIDSSTHKSSPSQFLVLTYFISLLKYFIL